MSRRLRRSGSFVATLVLTGPLLAAAPIDKRAASLILPAKPALRLHENGTLGYDWMEWRAATAARETRLKWRLGAVPVGSEAVVGSAASATGAPISQLFVEEKDRSTLLIQDTPWRRGGIMTLGVRLEF